MEQRAEVSSHGVCLRRDFQPHAPVGSFGIGHGGERVDAGKGEFGQSYNRRKGRSGAFGETVTTTMVEGGSHLWNARFTASLTWSEPEWWPIPPNGPGAVTASGWASAAAIVSLIPKS